MNRLRANNPARAGAGAASSNANAKGLPRTTPAPTALVDRRGTEEAKIRREIAIMKKCDHPNIIKFYSFIDDQMSANVCLIMEYMEGGELQWQSKSEQGGPYLTMDQTRRCTRDVVLGLQYLHTQGIIHRDIKPSNIMWTADRSHVKIGDFGVAHLVSPPPSLTSLALPPGVDGETQTQEEMDWEGPRHAGTPAFLAPEIAPGGESSTSTSPTSPASSSTAQRREAVTPAVDLWALGITLFCMLFGRLPFAPSAAAAASGPVGAEAGLYRAIREEEWWAGLGLPQHLLPPSSRSSSVLPPLPPSSSSSHSSRAGDGDGEGEREPTTTMCANRVPIKTADWERTGVLGLLNGLLQKDVGRRWGIGEVKVGFVAFCFCVRSLYPAPHLLFVLCFLLSTGRRDGFFLKCS
ncbi:kinase-like domain-containing protein [Mycena capillaripes]|nr:kinase-like domain-containing protein [Mycena capillaripes]